MVSVVEFLTDEPGDKVLIKGWESDLNPDVLTGNETGHAPYEEGDHLSYSPIKVNLFLCFSGF